DHIAPLGARHRPLHQEKLPLGIHAHHDQVRDGALLVTEMPGHALARKHVRRALVLAGRARRLVRDRVAVARALRMEMVAPDDAGEALAEGDALHVDPLADLEDALDAVLRARLVIRELLGLGAELAQRVARLDARLGEVPGERLGDAGRAALAA